MFKSVSVGGHRVLEHGGEVSGFTAENIVLPDDKIAVVVLTNQDAAEAASEIGSQVRTAMLQAENPQDPKQDALIRKVYDGLQQGQDRPVAVHRQCQLPISPSRR